MVVKSAKIDAPPTTASTLRRESRAASRCRLFHQATQDFQVLIIFILDDLAAEVPDNAEITRVVAASWPASNLDEIPLLNESESPRQMKPGEWQLVV